MSNSVNDSEPNCTCIHCGMEGYCRCLLCKPAIPIKSFPSANIERDADNIKLTIPIHREIGEDATFASVLEHLLAVLKVTQLKQLYCRHVMIYKSGYGKRLDCDC